MDLLLVQAQNPELLSRCLLVRRAVFIQEKGVPESLEVDQWDRLDGPCLHFLLQVDGQDAGALRCQWDEPACVRLQRFCLKKAFRGAGWGRAALDQVERYWAGRGVTEIRLDSKFEVCGFYEACGYARVSDVFLEADIPHVKMEKPLVSH